MRRGHGLDRRRLGLQEFLRARHIDVRTQGLQSGVYDQILAAHGLKRNLVLTMPSFQQALAVLAATDCISVLPSSMLDRRPFSESLVAVRPPIAQPARDLWVIWHQRHTEVPVHAWLRAALISLFSDAAQLDADAH